MEREFRKQNIRIAAFDLDGTVLQGGIMSEAVERSLRALSTQGIAVTVSTGRDISQIPLNVLDCFSYRVTTNGSSVTDKNGNELASHPIDAHTILDTIFTIHKHGGRSCIYYNGFVMASIGFLLRLITKTDFASKGQRQSTKGVRNNKIRFSVKRFVKHHGIAAFKIQAFFLNPQQQKDASLELEEKGLVTPVNLENNAMEVTMKGITKAHGLKELCDCLGCTPENIIAFGDSANDIEMLRTSGFAVGMGNAEDCVKQMADYITDPVTEDGVSTAINRLFSL